MTKKAKPTKPIAISADDNITISHIEDMGDDDFKQALTNPVKFSEDIEEAPEATKRRKPKKVKAKKPKSKRHPSKKVDALFETMLFDMQAFTEIYQKDLQHAKAALTEILSYNLAWSSALESIRGDLEHEPLFRGNVNIESTQLSSVLRYKNFVLLCKAMDVSPQDFDQFFLRSSEIRSQAMARRAVPARQVNSTPKAK